MPGHCLLNDDDDDDEYGIHARLDAQPELHYRNALVV